MITMVSTKVGRRADFLLNAESHCCGMERAEPTIEISRPNHKSDNKTNNNVGSVTWRVVSFKDGIFSKKEKKEKKTEAGSVLFRRLVKRV